MKQEHINQINAAVAAVAAKKNINHFYFVACGGSQAFMMPAQFMFDREIAIPAHLEAMDVIKNASVLAPWFDNACDAAVYTVYGQGAQAIVTGDETPESVMKMVQEAAASLH